MQPDPTELANVLAATTTLPSVAFSVAVAILVVAALGFVVSRVYPLPERARLSPPRDVVEQGTVEPSAPPVASEVVPVASSAPVVVETPAGLFHALREALARSRGVLREGLERLFARPLDAASLDELEEALLRADLGVPTTERLLASVRTSKETEPEALRAVLANEMRGILDGVHAPLAPAPGLWVVLIVGVNGSGKTTTIGKLASRLKAQGRRVLLAAGDTYRAAAEQQLGIWAQRAGVDIVALEDGADPAAVAFKAIERAHAEGHDVILVDTAGRLQTRKPLMEQLSKMRRVLDKAAPGAPHETLLVLDGTIGQNGMSQARLFHEATPLTGVVVTKLDGTAKGGMVLAIAAELGLPVKLVGLGEKVGDLRDFDPAAFVDALV